MLKRENIRLGKLDATDSEIEKAARDANAHSFIMLCPNKYDTLVGENGFKLSGDQIYRIGIARAFLRDPRILLLEDRPLSNVLNCQSLDVWGKLKKNRTTIIFSRKTRLAESSDLIYFYENNELTEVGTHKDLMEFKGLYFTRVLSEKEENYRECTQQVHKFTF